MTRRLGWLDLSFGASGDMLLGALVGAGVPLAVLSKAVAALDLPIELRSEQVLRAGIAATRVVVDAPEATQPHRTWSQVRSLLERLPEQLGIRANVVFAALAAAEGRVHGIDPETVHFHEVGALDALADVVGVCAGVAHLQLDALTASPVALGGGSIRTSHGVLPVPGPAVLALLSAAGAPAVGGPVEHELCTPTGAALVTALVSAWGALPALRVGAVGVGAGAREISGRPNVVRLVVGHAVAEVAGDAAAERPAEEAAVLLETNVDDLDPRVWPTVLVRLMTAGASDAWLTPILMKKGRPAHTLSVLCPPERQSALAGVVLRETPTLGLRSTVVRKRAAERAFAEVVVDGQPVSVKLGLATGGSAGTGSSTGAGSEVVTATPEWDDVAAAAEHLGRPVREVLARASELASKLLTERQG